MSDSYETILVETQGSVGWITLNRPEALNALNIDVMHEVVAAAQAFDADENVGCIVLTGSAKAFAAGADILQMQPLTYVDAYAGELFGEWDRLGDVGTPIVAAVAGYALGGGCELAMMCDLILAADSAKFGQPEITLGVIPGMGGSQRLTRAVGKAKAMDLCLTGRMMDADEAERSGLVARVVPADDLLDESTKVAGKIASMSRVATKAAKEAVNQAYESTLAEGVHFERRLFYGTFATEDKAEGMAAFVEKRKPDFKHR